MYIYNIIYIYIIWKIAFDLSPGQHCFLPHQFEKNWRVHRAHGPMVGGFSPWRGGYRCDLR